MLFGVSVSAINSSSLNISWTHPSLDRTYRYRLTYSLDVPGALTTTGANVSSTLFVLVGLHSGVPYRVSISVFADKQINSRGHDCSERVTGPMIFSTPEAKPLAAPTINRAIPTNETHVQLIWTQIELTQRGGVIIEYIIVFQRLLADQARLHPNQSTAAQSFGTQSNSTAYFFHAPQTYVRYHVQVCASTSVGRGPCSSAVIAQTKEGGTYIRFVSSILLSFSSSLALSLTIVSQSL